MVNSYNDIKSIIEGLYESNSLHGFVKICERTLKGRGFDRMELIRALAKGSLEEVHSILEPLVDNLIRKNVSLATRQEDQYAAMTLGNNEYRLRKIEDKDKYGRATGDYIIDLNKGTCTCPEFTMRLKEFTLPCKHQYIAEDKMEITKISSRESALVIKKAKKIYADLVDDILGRGLYNWNDFIEIAKKGEVIFLEDGRYVFKDAPEMGFKSTSPSLIVNLKEKGVPIYPNDKDEEIMRELSAVASVMKKLVTLADNFDNKGLSVEANIVDRIIAQEVKGLKTEACSTCAEHNKDKQKRRKRQVALLEMTR